MPAATCCMSARPRTSASGCPPTPALTPRCRAHPADDRSYRDGRDHLHHHRDRGAAAGSNLIKQLRPRFNVQLRDDKSFPYILISGDHWAPQILKHRGAQSRPGRYFGPFANAGASTANITALQRAFLIRSCYTTTAFSRAAPGPAWLYQSAAAPAPARARSTSRLQRTGARGERLPVRPQPCREAVARWRDGEGVQRARIRDCPRCIAHRLAALSAIQSQQGINPRTVEEADVFAIHQEGGYSCVEVFFFRTGQNWGNRAYFPKAEKSFTPEEVLASFLAPVLRRQAAAKAHSASHENRGKRVAGGRAHRQGRFQGGSSRRRNAVKRRS